jgi:hypothetical protein
MTYQPFPAAMFMGLFGQDVPIIGDGFPDYWHVQDADTSTSIDDVIPTTGLELTILAEHIKPDTNYLLIWSCEAAANASTQSLNCGLYQDDVQITKVIPATYATAPQDWHPCGGFWVYEAPSVIVDDVTFALKLTRISNLSTGMMRNKKLTVLKFGPDDQFVQDDGPSQNTGHLPYTLALSLTAVRPAEQSNYLFLISFVNSTSNPGVGSFFRIMDGGAELVGGASYGQYGERRAIAFGIRYDSMGTSKTISIEHSIGTAGSTSSVEYACIVALRLNRYDFEQTTMMALDNSGTDTSYVSARSLGFDPPKACDHLLIATVSWQGSNTSLSNYYKIEDDGVVITDAVRRCRISNDGLDWESGVGQTVEFYEADNRTQIIYRKSEASGTTTRIKALTHISTLSMFGLVRGDDGS